jgi:hypothetical protein
MGGAVVGNMAGDERHGGHGEDGERPEGSAPAHQLPGERAERHPDDVGEHRACAHDAQRARARGGTDRARGHHVAHRPERTGRQRRQKPGRQQQREAGAQSHDDVPDGEHGQGEDQCQPAGQAQGQHRHQRRADDHPDREHRDQKPGLGHADLHVSRDLRQQAGDHEFGRAHQKRGQGQDVHDERQPGGRALAVTGPQVGGGREGSSSRGHASLRRVRHRGTHPRNRSCRLRGRLRL